MKYTVSMLTSKHDEKNLNIVTLKPYTVGTIKLCGHLSSDLTV